MGVEELSKGLTHPKPPLGLPPLWTPSRCPHLLDHQGCKALCLPHAMWSCLSLSASQAVGGAWVPDQMVEWTHRWCTGARVARPVEDKRLMDGQMMDTGLVGGQTVGQTSG